MSEDDVGAHEALTAGAPGYAVFVAGETEMGVDLDSLQAYAGWLIVPGQDATDFAEWTAEQFEAEWERWNS